MIQPTKAQMSLIQNAYTGLFGAWADAPALLVEALGALGDIAKPEVRAGVVWFIVHVSLAKRVDAKTLIYLAEQTAARINRKIVQGSLKKSIRVVTGRK